MTRLGVKDWGEGGRVKGYQQPSRSPLVPTPSRNVWYFPKYVNVTTVVIDALNTKPPYSGRHVPSGNFHKIRDVRRSPGVAFGHHLIPKIVLPTALWSAVYRTSWSPMSGRGGPDELGFGRVPGRDRKRQGSKVHHDPEPHHTSSSTRERETTFPYNPLRRPKSKGLPWGSTGELTKENEGSSGVFAQL